MPALCAYYWDGGSSVPRKVLNISQSGACLATTDQWLHPGMIAEMTVQRQPQNGGQSADPPEILRVAVKVVRSGSGRIGVRFIFARPEERQRVRKFLKELRSQEGVSMSNGGMRGRGQALIEFALILPLLFLLIMNLVNFGAFIYSMITVANAARTGAQYMIMGGAWVGSPVPPNKLTQVIPIVTQDLSSLPNAASPSVQVKACTNNNGTVTCAGSGTFAASPNDPENTPGGAGPFVLATLDVSYPYTPLIPGWDFPGLGIHLTLPPTTVHRRAIMRMVQ